LTFESRFNYNQYLATFLDQSAIVTLMHPDGWYSQPNVSVFITTAPRNSSAMAVFVSSPRSNSTISVEVGVFGTYGPYVIGFVDYNTCAYTSLQVRMNVASPAVSSGIGVGVIVLVCGVVFHWLCVQAGCRKRPQPGNVAVVSFKMVYIMPKQNAFADEHRSNLEKVQQYSFGFIIVSCGCFSLGQYLDLSSRKWTAYRAVWG